MTRTAKIHTTGIYIPPREVPNSALKALLGAEHAAFVDKMEAKTNIRTRYWAEEDRAASDLAVCAAQHALERAELSPDAVDLLIVCTDTPDYISPATATVVQHKLGATNAGTFDIGCACASFPTGLATASGLIAANPLLERVLVVGVYMMHKLAAPDDPAIFFYGDGAGAALLTPTEGDGFVSSALQADGSYHHHWGIFAGATAEPATVDAVTAGRTRVELIEPYPSAVNEEGWPRLVHRLAEAGGFAVREIDLTVFTQVNRTTIERVMDRLELPLERTHMVMDRWGYTGSACIPLALHDALEQRRIEPGMLVALVGSGVGYNQAAAAFRF